MVCGEVISTRLQIESRWLGYGRGGLEGNFELGNPGEFCWGVPELGLCGEALRRISFSFQD